TIADANRWCAFSLADEKGFAELQQRIRRFNRIDPDDRFTRDPFARDGRRGDARRLEAGLLFKSAACNRLHITEAVLKTYIISDGGFDLGLEIDRMRQDSTTSPGFAASAQA